MIRNVKYLFLTLLLTLTLSAHAQKCPHDLRPAPKTSLGEEYVARHLEKFKEGVSCLSPSNVMEDYKHLGRADGLFVMPKSEVDDLLKRTGGDVSKIAKELGIPAGEWNKEEVQILRFDIEPDQMKDLRMPTGNEGGANAEWIPGGYTPTGNSEAVINAVNWKNVTSSKIK